MTSPFPVDRQLQKPVCVFCGSSPGKEPLFAAAAKSVGHALARKRIPLVYGGGRRGIMGVVSQSVLEAGGYSHGIVPQALINRTMENTSNPGPSGSKIAPQSKEGAGSDILQDLGNGADGRLSLEVTDGMHARKLRMAQLATGGFIVLPGGYGTFEEALEMITWNQLGIHSLPVIILNINNVYTPLRELFEKSVQAGFIDPKSLSLMRIIDLAGGETSNADPERANDWGDAAISAIESWFIESGAGYGLNWKTGSKDAISLQPQTNKRESSALSLFTTLRFTSPSLDYPTLPVLKAHIPLLERQIVRLKEAHAHFSSLEERKWGVWPGDDVVWDKLRAAIEKQEEQSTGDWRVRLLLHPGPQVEVQLIPAPTDAGPFSLTFPPDNTIRRRTLKLDPEDTLLSPEAEYSHEGDLRLYKTTNRSVYDTASQRAGKAQEVLLHTESRILETATSNIAIQTSDGTWITPKLSPEAIFLNGVARRELLSLGAVQEKEITLDDWEKFRREGRRVIGFNGLRGIWEADII